MTEKEARKMARRYPVETRAGWLLACDAPTNIQCDRRLTARQTITRRLSK